MLQTGYIYDVSMSYHANLNPSEDHPEDPLRIFSIYNKLQKSGLLNDCLRLPCKKAKARDVLLAHTEEHLEKIKATQTMSRNQLLDMENSHDSIYLNGHTYECSMYAIGSVIEACRAVLEDKVKNAFAIVRPPGHHAETEHAMGFCVMNNVAIATRYCMAHLGVKKVMILDWDIHFGNGTQEIFSEDADVLYVSLHRFENGSFYPQNQKGRADYFGSKRGKGKTVNIPWPKEGMGDADYIYAFEQVVMPIAREFGPSLVIVSAGFDAARGDHIGQCEVTPVGYGQMTHMLMSLANGRIVMALEGGYNLESIAVSSAGCMSVLMGEAPEPIRLDSRPSKICKETVSTIKKLQATHWKSLVE
ncbi:histone deacetylase-like protein 6 [Phycomyces nitens]|nr:histone deacetylase-like protein 6 [Phycomyces nitens]